MYYDIAAYSVFAIQRQLYYDIATYSVLHRERTDLTTDTESVPIYVDRIQVRSNERSVTDLAVVRRPYRLLHRMPPQHTATGGTKQ